MRFPSVMLVPTLLAVCCAPVMSQSAAMSASATQVAVTTATIPDGTPIRMRVIRMVSSESDQPGEQVEFEVIEDVTAGGATVVATGASIWGKVTAAHPADHGSNRPGVLELRIEGLKLPSGQIVPLRNLKALPMEADAEVSPEQLMDLVNSPYAPFARFARNPEITIPKNTPITLYVAADVPIAPPSGTPAPRVESSTEEGSGSVANRVVGNAGGARSLGDIAREQRRKGAIGSGMTTKRGTITND